LRERAQVEAGELFWGGVMSRVVTKLEGAVEGLGDMLEGSEGGGWHNAQSAIN
jgi:hypothetical protein